MSVPTKSQLQAKYPSGRVERVTLDVRWFPGAEDRPSEWRWPDLLDLPDPDYVRVVDSQIVKESAPVKVLLMAGPQGEENQLIGVFSNGEKLQQHIRNLEDSGSFVVCYQLGNWDYATDPEKEDEQ